MSAKVLWAEHQALINRISMLEINEKYTRDILCRVLRKISLLEDYMKITYRETQEKKPDYSFGTYWQDTSHYEPKESK